MLKEHGERTGDGRWRSGAADRNWQVISEIVAPLLPNSGSVVEIASGTGQHIVRFAETYPHLQWQPTEPDKDLRQSIRKEIKLSSLGNISAPLNLDVSASVHDLPQTKLILCVNMLHVSAYQSIQGLISCASLALEQSGHLYIYGPFKHNGEFNSEGNLKFDQTLRANRPEWGLREITDVIDTAESFSFLLERKVDMPANNTSLVFRLGRD
ncbi:MAG: DUF938 domain-containing protein [Pseudomonadales bacterium]|nr:DUF938 domain-containing protein [Pseudomonadales bacterium]